MNRSRNISTVSAFPVDIRSEFDYFLPARDAERAVLVMFIQRAPNGSGNLFDILSSLPEMGCRGRSLVLDEYAVTIERPSLDGLAHVGEYVERFPTGGLYQSLTALVQFLAVVTHAVDVLNRHTLANIVHLAPADHCDFLFLVIREHFECILRPVSYLRSGMLVDDLRDCSIEVGHHEQAVCGDGVRKADAGYTPSEGFFCSRLVVDADDPGEFAAGALN